LIKAIIRMSVDLHDMMFRGKSAMQLVQDYDIVIDGTDNFPTRYHQRRLCADEKPNIYGSIFRFDGQCTVFAPHWAVLVTVACSRSPLRRGWCPAVQGGVLGVCGHDRRDTGD
jgi:adenylyltransferase/sulfurtransferase